MNRVKKYLIYLSRCIIRIRYFPWKIPVLDILNKTLSVFGIYSYILLNKMDKSTIDFLETLLCEVIERYKYISVTSANSCYSGTIWTCWWQGEKQAPQLVRKCIESMRRNSGSYKVIVIDWDNLNQYADIPTHILELARNGHISYTHLSDVLRMKLLATHGGLWVDSTVFSKNLISPKLLREPFFSPPPQQEKRSLNMVVRKGLNWSIFFLQAAQSNHPLYLCISECYSLYFKRFPIEIHYFMTDYIISIIIQKINICHNDDMLNDDYPNFVVINPKDKNMTFEDIPDISFIKTTYKYKWSERRTDGKLTINGEIMTQKTESEQKKG